MAPMRWTVSLALTAWLCGCGPDKPEGPVEHPLRIGAVMVETGHRFETSGRAATAGRWGLAAYEAEELLELFEADMSRAPLPGDCNDTVSDSMYGQLIEEQLPALRAAATSEDRDAYAAAFRTASTSCNGCHAGCRVPFVEVPGEPGAEVPQLGTPAAAREAAPEQAPAEAPE